MIQRIYHHTYGETVNVYKCLQVPFHTDDGGEFLIIIVRVYDNGISRHLINALDVRTY